MDQRVKMNSRRAEDWGNKDGESEDWGNEDGESEDCGSVVLL